MHRCCLTLAFALLLCGMSVRLHGVQENRAAAGVIRYDPVHIMPGERTIRERAAAVDAVVLVRIAGPATARVADITAQLQQRNRGMDLRDPVIVPVTEYPADVVEVFKDSGTKPLAGTINVGTIGGEADWRGRKVVGERRTDLEPGATYLVFLKYSPELEAQTFVDWDVFRMDGRRATGSPYASETEYGRTIIRRPPAQVLEMVRRETR